MSRSGIRVQHSNRSVRGSIPHRKPQPLPGVLLVHRQPSVTTLRCAQAYWAPCPLAVDVAPPRSSFVRHGPIAQATSTAVGVTDDSYVWTSAPWACCPIGAAWRRLVLIMMTRTGAKPLQGIRKRSKMVWCSTMLGLRRLSTHSRRSQHLGCPTDY